MNPEEVRQALEIVDHALELRGSQREAYLDTVCGTDTPLRREVLNYLRFEDAASDEASTPELRPDIE